MQEKITELTHILTPYGFELGVYEKSGSFGEYYITFNLSHFKLRFIHDRGGADFIEINSNEPSGEWMPLGFIIAVIEKKKNLITGSEASKLESHLKNHFEDLKYSFDPKNFPSFKERLYQLARKRGFQLFPKLYLRPSYSEQLEKLKQNYPDLVQFFSDCFAGAECGNISDSDAIREYKKKVTREKIKEIGLSLDRLSKEMEAYWIGISVYLELAFRNIKSATEWLETVQRELKTRLDSNDSMPKK